MRNQTCEVFSKRTFLGQSTPVDHLISQTVDQEYTMTVSQTPKERLVEDLWFAIKEGAEKGSNLKEMCATVYLARYLLGMTEPGDRWYSAASGVNQLLTKALENYLSRGH